MTISNWMAALALINGTAGGIVLVLPIIGLQAGWLMIPFIIFIASLCCYYTATLMFMHLGKAQTINQCILNHFHSQKYCQIYNITMFLSFFGEMILYYDLLVSESEGLLYFLTDNIKTLIPFCAAIFLIVLALLTRFFHEEDNLISYGILSMLAYAMFIAWIILQGNPGSKRLPAAKGTFIELSAAMSQGYSIHNMMIPIILRARDPQNYKKILTNVFVIGGIFYTFVAYGSFGLANRQPLSGDGQIVEDFFAGNQWEIYVLRLIYIVNIVTVFPEFLSISRIRFFNIFKQEQIRQKPLQKKEVIYYIVIIGVCLATKILKVQAPTIIELNGSIICFVQIYLIPISIHLKCIWFNQNQPDRVPFGIQPIEIIQKSNQIKNIQDMTKTEVKSSKFQKQIIPDQNQQQRKQICECNEEINSKDQRYKQLGLSFLVLTYGIFVMLYTFYTVFLKPSL